MIRKIIISAAVLVLFSCASENGQSIKKVTQNSTTLVTTEQYSVLLGGTKVGGMTVNRAGNSLDIVYGFKNNGRGPNSTEILTLSYSGIP